MDRLSAFERELKKIFDKLKAQMTERRYGSERSALFLKYLSETVPPHYTKMLKEFYQNNKKVQQANAKQKERTMADLAQTKKKLKEEVAMLKEDFQYYKSDEDDYDEEEYFSE